jgi:uncharacterized membrane protein YkvA (DUF1232 family)
MSKFIRYFRITKKLLRKPDELLNLMMKGIKLAYLRKAALVHIFDDFLLLIRLVKAWVKGDYQETPHKVIFWAVLAVVYFVSPIDAFPDLLPGGFVDDIAFIGFVIGRIRSDLDRFQLWEKS